MVAAVKLHKSAPAIFTWFMIIRTTASLAKYMSTASVVLKTNARVRVSCSISPTETMKRHLSSSLPAGKFSRYSPSALVSTLPHCSHAFGFPSLPSSVSVTRTLPTGFTLAPLRASAFCTASSANRCRNEGSSWASCPFGISTVPLMVGPTGGGLLETTVTSELPPPQPAINVQSKSGKSCPPIVSRRIIDFPFGSTLQGYLWLSPSGIIRQ